MVKIEIELDRSGRFYDRFRRRVRRPKPGKSSDLRDLVMLLPDLTMLLTRLLRDPRVAVGDKAIALLGVGYVVSPLDLLPTFLFGPLGFLDDAFVLAATFSRLINHVHPDVVRAHWSGQGDALEAIQRLTDWCESQVGGRLRALIPGG